METGQEGIGESARLAQLRRAICGPHFDVSGGGCQAGETSQSHQVVSGAHQIPGAVDALQPADARLTKATHGLHPAEDFFNPPSYFLTRGVARSTGGPSVHGAASAGRVLRDVGRDTLGSQALHTLARVVALVGTERLGMKPAHASVIDQLRD